jgi:HEAT repeat protein
MRTAVAIASLLICLLGKPAVGGEDAAALLKVIQSAATADVDRANAFEKIGDLAGDEAVEPLASYLSDKKWSHYARFALQKMPGQQVTAALVKSLDSLPVDLKIGVIVTIGRRHDPAAIAALAKYLADPEASIADASANALGAIGTSESTAVLQAALAAATDPARRASLGAALLFAGQRLVQAGQATEAVAVFDLLRGAEVPASCRVAATQNAILARGAEGVELLVEQLKSLDRDYFEVGLAAARVLPGDGTTERVLDVLAKETVPGRQVLLIQALVDRRDKRALPAMLSYLQGESPTVRLAAIGGVGVLGDGSSVETLLSVADGATADAALEALTALPGADVNSALIQAARGSDKVAIAVRVLGKRRVSEAADRLFELAQSDAGADSLEAIVALGAVAPEDRFLELIALLKAARSAERKAALQEAVHGAITRSTRPDVCAETLGAMIPGSEGADREYLFEQVRTAGGAKAVALMRQFALGPDEALQDAATKMLGEWLSADAGPVLLEVARGNGKYANRALGGYIRLFRQFELPETERVAMAAEALKVASRPTERNAALEAMTRFPCVGTFELALAQLGAKGSETAAAEATLTIARTVLDLDPQKGKAGLRKLIDANINDDVTAAAKVLLE